MVFSHAKVTVPYSLMGVSYRYMYRFVLLNLKFLPMLLIDVQEDMHPKRMRRDTYEHFISS